MQFRPHIYLAVGSLLYLLSGCTDPPSTITQPPAATTPQAQPTSPVDTSGESDPVSTYTGRVVRIADGDTITVLVGKTQHRVRLEGIDCPELGQPFGRAARTFTSKRCFGRDVEVRLKGQDQYGRDLGEVLVDGTSLNRDLLAAGLAWHFKRYNQDPELAALED